MQIQPDEEADRTLNKVATTRALPKISSIVGLLSFLLPWVLLKGCGGSAELSGAQLINPPRVGNTSIAFIQNDFLMASPAIIGLCVLVFIFRFRKLAQREDVERLTMLFAITAILPALDVILSFTATPAAQQYVELRGGVWINALAFVSTFVFAMLNLRLVMQGLAGLTDAGHRRTLGRGVKIAAIWNFVLVVLVVVGVLINTGNNQMSYMVNLSQSALTNIGLFTVLFILLGTLASVKLWRGNGPRSGVASSSSISLQPNSDLPPILALPEENLGQSLPPPQAMETAPFASAPEMQSAPSQAESVIPQNQFYQHSVTPEARQAENFEIASSATAQKTEVLNAPLQTPVKAWLLARDGALIGQKFNITEEGARIGRATDNDIVLSDDAVGRYHARIKLNDGVFELFDLASTNGVFKKMPSGEWARIYREFIEDGDQIRIGETTFSFYEMPKQ